MPRCLRSSMMKQGSEYSLHLTEEESEGQSGLLIYLTTFKHKTFPSSHDPCMVEPGTHPAFGLNHIPFKCILAKH